MIYDIGDRQSAKTELVHVQVADRRDPPDGPLQGASDSSIGRRHHDWGGAGELAPRSHLLSLFSV